MDWSTILPFIAGGGLIAIFTVPAAIRKAKIENESLAIGPLRETNTQLREEIARKDAQNQALEEKYQAALAKGEEKQAATMKRYEDKCEESATAKSMMCIHLGCSLRDPLLGQGDTWLQDHQDDISLGVDYTPINVLMKRLGERRRYQQQNEDKTEDKE